VPFVDGAFPPLFGFACFGAAQVLSDFWGRWGVGPGGQEEIGFVLFFFLIAFFFSVSVRLSRP